MTDGWAQLASYALGVASGAAAAFFTPLRNSVERYGRRALERSQVDVDVETRLERIWAGFPDWNGADYFFPGPRPDFERVHSIGEFERFAHRHQAVDCRTTIMQVTVVSKSAATVVVGRPVVSAHARALPAGTRISRPAPGGASMEPTSVDVELTDFAIMTSVHNPRDRSNPVLSWVLKTGEAHQFYVRVKAVGDVLWTWSAVLPLIADGRKVDVSIGAPDKPFLLAGGAEDRWADLWMTEGGWQDPPPMPA